MTNASATHAINLPHENKDVFYLTDSGLETQLIFKDNIELPEFAAFTLLTDQRGFDHAKAYYRRHASLAAQSYRNGQPTGFVFESMTWRASSDWLQKTGYLAPNSMQEISNKAIQVMAEVRAEFPELANYAVLSGNIGPRGDGYVASMVMTVEEAKDYHFPQVEALKKAGVDMITAATLNYIEEGIGISLAAKEVGIPVVISYTLETDGHLVTGESLQKTIESIDAATNSTPAYYMINCAHPTHFVSVFSGIDKKDSNVIPSWLFRIGGIRGNASKMSHAELDNASELDDGNPEEFGNDNLTILQMLPEANVFGGCCGTDIRHVESILSSCAAPYHAARGMIDKYKTADKSSIH